MKKSLWFNEKFIKINVRMSFAGKFNEKFSKFRLNLNFNIHHSIKIIISFHFPLFHFISNVLNVNESEMWQQ
jgi:hypothetical protein